MKKFCTIFATLILAACAGPKGDKGDQGPQGEPAPTPVVDTVQAAIDAEVALENEYRLGLGQTILSSGLSCSVVKVNSGQWLSSSSPGYNAGQGVVVTSGNTTYTYLYKGDFNQENSSGGAPNILLPVTLQPLFINTNYKISCTGQIVVLESGWYNFSVSSDDGSILTVDGTQVVNNDGNHGITTKSGSKYLRRGVKSFSVQYAQTGGGNFAMILKANNALIAPIYLFH